jgi:hypothetical protein
MPVSTSTPDPRNARVDVQFNVWGDAPEQDTLPPGADDFRLQPAGDQPLLSVPLSTEGADRAPDYTWPLPNARPHADAGATGRAAVFLRNSKFGLQRPFIFADGFNYGPSDLDDLWSHFNNHGLLERLLLAGRDVVLLGFDTRHGHIQDNAGIAISCIQRAIAERIGDEPLIVGGVSMGGIVTRYALAAMEHEGLDHQTNTYISYDSPHNGAWTPIVLQQLAYLFENVIPTEPGKNKPADLIRSPAAQQLLWAWVENARYSGPVATSSELRTKFVEELGMLGGFPQRPRLLGVANGAADGARTEAVPGEVVFDWVEPTYEAAAAQARIQPEYGEKQEAGRMRLLLDSRASSTSDLPPFDSAPGGTLGSYEQLAKQLGIELAPRHLRTCFVPTVSAIALQADPLAWPSGLFRDISTVKPEESRLDDYVCSSTNTEHSAVTPELADWVIDHLA